ncbi:MAG: hypothetical protein R3247_09695 [Rhodothermales bacterium]|nr:hypothetical protein [Rhodothermales bacterium]
MKTPEQARITSWFRYPGRRWFIGRARLYADHLALAGWSWRGREAQRIPLRDVDEVKWYRTGRLVLRLRDGHAVSIEIDGSGLWKFALEEALGRRLTVCEQLPEHVSRASAA